MSFNLEVGMTGRVDLVVEDKHSAANFWFWQCGCICNTNDGRIDGECSPCYG